MIPMKMKDTVEAVHGDSQHPAAGAAGTISGMIIVGEWENEKSHAAGGKTEPPRNEEVTP